MKKFLNRDNFNDYIHWATANHAKWLYIVLSVSCFIITSIIAYPFNMHWDSAYVFSKIYSCGYAELSAWMGWYFPLLWEYLYKCTGIPTFIGFYINAVYWVGVTMLFFAVFDLRKASPLWYFVFCLFPTSVIFILSITNNALYFVTFLLGLSMYLLYKNVVKRKILLILSFAIMFSSIFIRRDAVFMVLPLLAFFISFEFSKHQVLFFIGSAMSLVAAVYFVSNIEHRILLKKNSKYYDFKTTSVTIWHDLTNISYYAKKNVIPAKYLKNEFQKNPDDIVKYIPEVILSDSNDVKLQSFYKMVLKNSSFTDLYTTTFDFTEIIFPYINNLSPYFFHRINFLSQLLYKRAQLVSYTHYASAFDNFHPKINHITVFAGWLWSFFIPAIGYYFAGIVYLCVSFRDIKRRNFIAQPPHDFNLKIFTIVTVTAFFSTGVNILGAVSPQVRYIVPMMILIYWGCVQHIYISGILKKSYNAQAESRE